jgi:hypothetical protein
MSLYNIQKNVNIPKVKITTLTKSNPAGTVEFFPFDFQFDDNIKPEWNSYGAFGRMDPIMIYKRTTRDVSLSFNVVADSPEDAITNFKNLQKLISFLYPTYNSVGLSGTTTATTTTQTTTTAASGSASASPTAGATIGNPPPPKSFNTSVQIINKSPLMVIEFMNLLNNNSYVIAVSNFKHKLDFEFGASSLKGSKATPGKFNISISFKILHTSIQNILDGNIYDNNFGGNNGN